MIAVKIILVVLVMFIVFNLFKAMFVMLKDDSEVPMSKFIGRRLMFSVLVILLLLIGVATGLIEPNPRPY